MPDRRHCHWRKRSECTADCACVYGRCGPIRNPRCFVYLQGASADRQQQQNLSRQSRCKRSESRNIVAHAVAQLFNDGRTGQQGANHTIFNPQRQFAECGCSHTNMTTASDAHQAVAAVRPVRPRTAAAQAAAAPGVPGHSMTLSL